MKRAELEIGKAYYLSQYNDWACNGRAISGWKYNNLTECAIKNKNKKVIVLETQLKTDYERKYRTREVFIQRADGRTEWVSLTHLRGDFAFCIKSVFEWRKITDDRDSKYKAHLQRKQQREVYKPTYKQMIDTLSELTGKGIYGWDRIEDGFSLEQLQTINEALSLLKTQKPNIQAVA